MLQLVLINISDHHVRMRVNGLAQGSGRVFGCLLGQQIGREVSVSNSFEMKVEDKMGEPEVDEAFLLKKQEQCKIRQLSKPCSNLKTWLEKVDLKEKRPLYMNVPVSPGS